MSESTDILRRLPPQNIEAEASVLGAILLDNAALDEVVLTLRPDHFYREAHRAIYEAMVDLRNRPVPIDALTLSELLRTQNVLEAIGGTGYIAELASLVPTAANARYYAEIVRNKAVLRTIAGAATEIAAGAYDNPEDAATFADDAARRIVDATDMSVQSELYDAVDLMRGTLATAERAYERRELVTGLATGFTDLDRITSGLQASELIVIAARPSRGKTALGLNIATNAALAGANVLFFSLEMSKEQLMMRMSCSLASVNLQRYRDGTISRDDIVAMTDARARIEAAAGRLLVNDASDISPMRIKAMTRRAVRTMGSVSLVVIDYIQLMRPDRSYRDSREREVADISRSLKALAKEFRIPVIALAQLNRQTEARSGGRPGLADLRESGAIEQDADVVAFIHAPEAYKAPEQRDPNAPTILIIAKQRNGPTDDVEMAFLREYTRFESYIRGGETA